MSSPQDTELARSATRSLPTRLKSLVATIKEMGPATILAYLVLVLALLWAIFPGLFAPFDPIISVPGQQLRPPNPVNYFGTDALGATFIRASCTARSTR